MEFFKKEVGIKLRAEKVGAKVLLELGNFLRSEETNPAKLALVVEKKLRMVGKGKNEAGGAIGQGFLGKSGGGMTESSFFGIRGKIN